MSVTLNDIPLVPRIVQLAHEHGSTDNMTVAGELTIIFIFNTRADGGTFIDALHLRGWNRYFSHRREYRAGYFFVWLTWKEENNA